MDDGPHPEQAVEHELIEPPKRKRRTHCPHGHELVGANVYRRPSRPNEIECRICKAERARRHPYKHKPRGGPNGRPPHRPTPELRQIVTSMAAAALTHEQIARMLGLRSVTTLEKYYRNELDRGTIRVHAAVGSVFIKKCLGGDPNDPDNPPDWRKADVPSLLHYVRTRMGWTEQTETVFKFGQGRDFETI
jgi:hypothetical protein